MAMAAPSGGTMGGRFYVRHVKLPAYPQRCHNILTAFAAAGITAGMESFDA